jgi:hypothetical protein
MIRKQHQMKKVRHLVQNKLSKQKKNKNHSATDSLCLVQREYDDDDTKLWHNNDYNNDDDKKLMLQSQQKEFNRQSLSNNTL